MLQQVPPIEESSVPLTSKPKKVDQESPFTIARALCIVTFIHCFLITLPHAIIIQSTSQYIVPESADSAPATQINLDPSSGWYWCKCGDGRVHSCQERPCFFTISTVGKVCVWDLIKSKDGTRIRTWELKELKSKKIIKNNKKL